jgi:ubiquinone/menaquinone biosynthesis C-methylase UbiE
MGLWVDLQYYVLRKAYPRSSNPLPEKITDHSKLSLLGAGLQSAIRGKIVIDFGCGKGEEAIEMARMGALRVTGVDIQDAYLEIARERAATAGFADQCTFVTATSEAADVITSIDAFEHFDDPAAILRMMFSLLKPGGEVLLSFGPTWFHPLGGHLFSVFPWAHVLFAEEALIRWRSDFKSDGARRFSEVAGGLNRMTLRRFEQLVSESGFRAIELECVPIRKVWRVHARLTREFTTAVCRGRLRKPA